MTKIMNKWSLLLAALAFFCAAPAKAQDDFHRFEVYGGYSYVSADDGALTTERTGLNGFNASVTGNLHRYVGLKFDYAYHRNKSTFSDPIPIGGTVSGTRKIIYNSFLGGVQIKDNSKEKRFKPFAHALFGVRRLNQVVEITDAPAGFELSTNAYSDTGFAAALGGGLDIRVGRRVDVRVIQFDYNPRRRTSYTEHNFRIGAGIVFH